jgi:hypothetical protein
MLANKEFLVSEPRGHWEDGGKVLVSDEAEPLTPERIEKYLVPALRECGLAVVPIEPTEAMISAGLATTYAWQEIPGSAMTVNREKMRRRYKAMVEAADKSDS